MTPEESIVAACIKSGVDDLISPGILRNLVRSIEEACSAALRERDAQHEIALKTARAVALDAAAALFDKKDAEARAETYFVTQPSGGVREEHPNGYYMSAREAARAIRALLEEAGNG